jgi:hypothetical protein
MTRPIDYIVDRFRGALEKLGTPIDVVERMTDEFDTDIRNEYGATWQYLHGKDLRKRNRVVMNAWNSALVRNAELPRDKRETLARIRDRVCNDHGITRVTLYDILSGRIADQNKP